MAWRMLENVNHKGIPQLSISRVGRISISRALYDVLGKPAELVLLFDDETRMLGVKAGHGFRINLTTLSIGTESTMRKLGLAPRPTAWRQAVSPQEDDIWAITLPSQEG